jgi:hypothetical protein
MTSRYGPVSGRATDLEHADPESGPDAHQIRGPRELPIRVLATA